MLLSAAPLFEDVAQGPDGGVAYWVTTIDDVRIRFACWAPGNAKGTVLIFPGRSEYIEKYGPVAVDIGERGYSTLVIDWRGQGLADRLIDETRIGHVEEFIDYQKDVSALMLSAQALDLPRPYYLLSHSMGGSIGLRAVMEGLDVQAAIFASPMWGIQMDQATHLVARVLSWSSRLIDQHHRLTPMTGMGLDAYPLVEPFENNKLTTDREMYALMASQLTAHPELALGGPSLGWLHEALKETKILTSRTSPNLPCLTWVGSDDRVVDLTSIYNRMSTWPGGTLDVFEGKEHEVLMHNSAMRNRLFDDAVKFFSDH